MTPDEVTAARLSPGVWRGNAILDPNVENDWFAWLDGVGKIHGDMKVVGTVDGLGLSHWVECLKSVHTLTGDLQVITDEDTWDDRLLRNLESANFLEISRCDNLIALDNAFPSLRSVPQLSISYNDKLRCIDSALPSVSASGFITIMCNPKLVSGKGLMYRLVFDAAIVGTQCRDVHVDDFAGLLLLDVLRNATESWSKPMRVAPLEELSFDLRRQFLGVAKANKRLECTTEDIIGETNGTFYWDDVLPQFALTVLFLPMYLVAGGMSEALFPTGSNMAVISGGGLEGEGFDDISWLSACCSWTFAITLIIVMPLAVLSNGPTAAVATLLVMFILSFVLMFSACLAISARNDLRERPLTRRDPPVRFNARNLRNWLAFSSIMLESLQLSSLSYVDRAFDSSASPEPLLNFTVADFGPSVHAAAFWMVFVIGMAWTVLSALLASMARQDDRWTNTLFSLPLFDAVVGLLSKDLFLTVTVGALRMFDCTYVGTSKCGVDAPYLDSNDCVRCWRGAHTGLAIAGGVLLLYYTVSALTFGGFFGRSYDGSTDAVFLPAYSIAERLLKLLAAVCGVFLSGYEVINLVVLFIVYFVLIAVNIRYQPCICAVFNQVKVYGFSASAWTLMLGYLAASFEASPGNRLLATVMLYMGWIMCLVSAALVCVKAAGVGEEEVVVELPFRPNATIRATFPYHKQHSDEISFESDEVMECVHVCPEAGSNWALARRSDMEEARLVPKCYFTVSPRVPAREDDSPPRAEDHVAGVDMDLMFGEDDW